MGRTNTIQAPGLKFFKRVSGHVPYWVADEKCVKAGFPVKTRNLSHLAGNDAAIITACEQLQQQMIEWKERSRFVERFDGTWGSLLRIYETDADSPFNQTLKHATQRIYLIYLRKLKNHIGEIPIDATDGRQIKRWFAEWAGQEDPNNPRAPYKRLSVGRMALAVLKAAVTFGVICRYQGCAEIQVVIQQLEFPVLRPRVQAPTRAQMVAATEAAIAAGAPSRALAYAIQYETMLRQADVIGEWVGLDDPRPSSIISRGEKWVGGLHWKMVDENLVLRVTHGKTEDTSGARSVFDLKLCPMVMQYIAAIPVEQRVGPMIVSEATGLPYRYRQYLRGWRTDYDAAGIPADILNRDTRAGGNTEAQMKGAPIEDRKKVIGHTAGSRTTAKVYDRDTLAAHRRVAQARLKDATE